ncbi:hypothetical protein E2C01_027713 [Portunus trituberculatus]|uniref:Uncharacterized protein n=1 Tax=Portunus trituberculatus TaxID=210409 RepID=A0A5B7ELX2_PORTR|nr:hypothetical protein [Portunus trituberculatus]
MLSADTVNFFTTFPPTAPPVAAIAVQMMQSLGCPRHVSVQIPLRLTVSAVTRRVTHQKLKEPAMPMESNDVTDYGMAITKRAELPRAPHVPVGPEGRNGTLHRPDCEQVELSLSKPKALQSHIREGRPSLNQLMVKVVNTRVCPVLSLVQALVSPAS